METEPTVRSYLYIYIETICVHIYIYVHTPVKPSNTLQNFLTNNITLFSVADMPSFYGLLLSPPFLSPLATPTSPLSPSKLGAKFIGAQAMATSCRPGNDTAFNALNNLARLCCKAQVSNGQTGSQASGVRQTQLHDVDQTLTFQDCWVTPLSSCANTRFRFVSWTQADFNRFELNRNDHNKFLRTLAQTAS